MRDFKRMQTDPPEGVNGAPLDNDIMKWHAVIFGCAGQIVWHFSLRMCSLAPFAQAGGHGLGGWHLQVAP